MYSGVPSTVLRVVSPAESATRASPKSHRRTSSAAGIRPDEDVLRLDVPVNDAGPVRRFQRAAELRRQPPHLRRRQRPAARQPVGEVAARVQLHHQEEELPVLDDVVDPDHVRVLDPPDDLRLAHETSGDDRIAPEIRVQQLHRDLDPPRLVARREHPRDAPLPERAKHPIPPVEQHGERLDPDFRRLPHHRHPRPAQQPNTTVGYLNQRAGWLLAAPRVATNDVTYDPPIAGASVAGCSELGVVGRGPRLDRRAERNVVDDDAIVVAELDPLRAVRLGHDILGLIDELAAILELDGDGLP